MKRITVFEHALRLVDAKASPSGVLIATYHREPPDD
jgi:hypothetical protein